MRQLARASTHGEIQSRERGARYDGTRSRGSLSSPKPGENFGTGVSSHRSSALRIGLLALLLVLPAARITYALPASLNGSFRLIGVNTDDQNAGTQSLNQEYSLRWTRTLASAMRAQAFFRYDRYGADLGEGTQFWREEMQPGGSLTWRHSWLSLGSEYEYRKSLSSDHSTDLIRDRLGFDLRTRAFSYPITSISVDFEQSFNRLDRQAHDNRRTRIYGTAAYQFHRADFLLSSDLVYSRNRASNLKTTEARHMFRWNQSADIIANRWRMASTYYLSYRTEGLTSLDVDSSLRVLEPVAGLYARDATPELGELDTARGLIDGNLEAPAAPGIEIGQGQIDQNIGVDLGFARKIVAFYIYTDRASGASVRWDLYTSADNITWQRVPQTVIPFYNAAAFRYELTFDPIEARYVKVVNSGTNEVLNVRVTEVESLERITLDRKQQRSQTAHQLDITSAYDLSERWHGTVTLGLRKEPKSSFETGRDRVDAGATVRHQANAWLTQSLRLQTDWEKYQLNQSTQRNRSLAYALILNPLPTARVTFSAQTRRDDDGSQPLQETNNLTLQTTAQLFPGLKLASESGYSRINTLIDGRNFNTWMAKVRTESQLWRNIDVSLSALVQTTREPGGEQSRFDRTRYTLDGVYRVTRSLSVRGGVSLSNDNARTYLEQDYGLNWLMSRKLSLSAVAQTDQENSLTRLRRRIVSLTLHASNRTSLFGSYLYTGADQDNQPEISSVQIGLTSGF